MNSTTEEFVSSFHSLEGFTLAERRKNLFYLLTKIQKNEEINFDLLHPKTVLEGTFKIESMIYFRRVPELLKVLKSGNSFHIAKVLRASNLFLEEAFKNISGEDLVKDVFPCMSFRTKIKVLHKLVVCLNDIRKAEEFFDALQKAYGLHLAANLIPGCSGQFILERVKANRIELTPAQLMIIIRKYPELTEDIFEAFNGYTSSKISIEKKYKAVFSNLMKTNPCLFLKMCQKFKLECCAGRRTTKRLISLHKNEVIANSKFIFKVLNNKQAVRSLNDDFNKFYCNSFPKTLVECKDQYKSLLALLKSLDAPKLNLLTTIFKKTYGTELFENPAFMNVQFFEIMSPDERETWMQTYSKPDKIPELQWVSFMKTDKSLPIFKKRVSLTSNLKVKARVIPYLVATCQINGDKLAFSDSCAFMLTQHVLLRNRFLNAIIAQCDLYRLDGKEWVSINKLLELNITNADNYFKDDILRQAYIAHCFKTGLPVENQLSLWALMQHGRLDLQEPKHQKEVLTKFALYIKDNYSFLFSSEPLEYLQSLADWNKAHPKDYVPFEVYSKAIKYIKSSMEKHQYMWDMEGVITKCLTCPSLSQSDKSDLLDAIFKCKRNRLTGLLVLWLLKNDLPYVTSKIDVIMEGLLQSLSRKALCRLWRQLKNYEHVGIPQKVSNICKAALEQAGDSKSLSSMYWDRNKLECVIGSLSYLIHADEFLSFVKAYNPSMCKIQRYIVTFLKNVNPSPETFETMLNFGAGDYVNLFLKSLELMLLDAPETELAYYLNKLYKGPVPVQKQAVCLTFRYGNKAQVCAMLAKFADVEDASIQKYLFKGTFNFFVQNPEEHFWNLLKQNIGGLDINDTEGFGILLRVNRIPKTYLSKYLILVWDVLERNSESCEAEERMCQILDAVTLEIFPSLPEHFATAIITRYFCKSEEPKDFSTRINIFACKYVVCWQSSEEQNNRLKLLFDIISSNASPCTIIYNFTKDFCTYFLEQARDNLEVFHKYFLKWNDVLNRNVSFVAYLHLKLTSICLTCSTLREIGGKLESLFHE